MTTYRGTTALITGASSGLGAEFAAQFASRAADVVLVARREDRLRELAERLERENGVRATAIPLDLARPDATAVLRDELDRRGVAVHTLVNNAGFGMKGAFAHADPARVAELVQVDVAALVALTREFLPGFVSAGSGVIVNVASTAAFQACPSMAVYGASKAFVLSFTEAIAYEVRGSGVKVLVVSPGATATEFFDVVGDPRAAVGRPQTPRQVVDAVFRALDREHTPPGVVSGRLNAIAAALSGIVPRRLTAALSGRLLGA